MSDTDNSEREAEEKFMALKEYTKEEIFKHATEEDCWLLIHNRVYDISEYMEEHPGGPEIMTNASKKDATDE